MLIFVLLAARLIQSKTKCSIRPTLQLNDYEDGWIDIYKNIRHYKWGAVLDETIVLLFASFILFLDFRYFQIRKRTVAL